MKWNIARHKRRISPSTYIAVTGSSAKSTTVGILAHVLASQSNVYRASFNNSLDAIVDNFCNMSNKSDYYVGEVGVSQPDQMNTMAKLLRPSFAAITLIGIEHYKGFRKLDNVAAEKSKLLTDLPADGAAFLNRDDPYFEFLSKASSAPVVSFGMHENADFRVSEVQARFPQRLSFRVSFNKDNQTFSKVLNTQFVPHYYWLATVIAFAIAVHLGVDPEIARARIASFAPITNRCGVLCGRSGALYIIDSVKSPYHSIDLAISMIAHAEGFRKRLVLGHISDYQRTNNFVYKRVYQAAMDVFDEVIFVGRHAHRSQASEQGQQKVQFFAFETPKQVSDYMQRTARSDDLVLIKGSQDLHLERIAMSDAFDVFCWEATCKNRTVSCLQCGLFAFDYAQHTSKSIRKIRQPAPENLQPMFEYHLIEADIKSAEA